MKAWGLSRQFFMLLVVILVIIFIRTIHFYFFNYSINMNPSKHQYHIQSFNNGTNMSTPYNLITSQLTDRYFPIASDFIDKIKNMVRNDADIDIEIPCNDTVYCRIEMPTISYFKFDPPNDRVRWRKAQALAASGDPAILREILKHFKNPFEFIDGDVHFRSYHYIPDLFLDTSQRDMKPLTKARGKLDSGVAAVDSTKLTKYPWEKEQKNVVPTSNYNYRAALRAPIMKYGYHAFEAGHNYFTGKMIGEAYGGRNDFYNRWLQVKNDLETPFILFHSQNENWGLFSTYFPNRTADWGRCCDDPPDQKHLLEFLNDDKTLMVLTNQHFNISHPKILCLPRGLPGPDEFSRKMVWDTMRTFYTSGKRKGKLLFTATSSWGPRPQIVKCVSEKFESDDFQGLFAGPELKTTQKRISKSEYYTRLAGARYCLSLPGLGYDTYRLWESMCLGVIPIIEKNVGFDRMLWRLPVLMVEDYDVVTPTMLRVAYIEAIYRAKDFEYQRLTQRFWQDFIWNVSSTVSPAALYELFPVEAEDPNFTRPAVPYDCGDKGEKCGPGTKTTPKSYC